MFLWLRNVLGDDRQFVDELPELADIEEEYTMLAETIRKHDKKIYADGRQEGEEIGLRRAALRLKDKGHSREEIAQLLEMPLDQVP